MKTEKKEPKPCEWMKALGEIRERLYALPPGDARIVLAMLNAAAKFEGGVIRGKVEKTEEAGS